MAEEDPKRREQDLTVDKTMRVTTTLGFMISLVLGVWFIGRWTDAIEDENILLRQEIHEVLDIVQRTQRRQDVYIGRNNTTHDIHSTRDEEFHAMLMEIREYLAAKHGEILP